MNSSAVEIFKDFLSLFFPNCCLACQGPLVKGEEMVCTECMLEMPQTSYHLNIDNPLKTRINDRTPLAYALALFKFSKNGRVQHLLHALKYKNHPEIGVMLGKVYGAKLMESGLSTKFDLILPIPLHEARLRKRGYNQSAKFAEGLSQKLNIPFTDNLLERRVNTQTQTRKTRLNRWQNVSDVFQVNNKEAILDKHILLVDDVITTGATVEGCGQMLLAEGCGQLSIACLAEA